MKMRPMVLVSMTVLGLVMFVASDRLSGAQSSTMPMPQGAAMPRGAHDMPMPAGTANMTKEQKIANAMAAGPSDLSGKATIMDWPAKEGAPLTVLRAGTNGWTCLPDAPNTTGNDPMCLDQPWMSWIESYLAKKTPRITRIGIGYMIAPGGAAGSNTDPFATSATADNHWGHHPPHVMIVVPDPKVLDGMSTDPMNGGPYVMFKGTPYAHIMAPVTGHMMTDMMPARSGAPMK
jgi:hypothetical protein